MEQVYTEQFTPVAWANNTNIYEVNLRQYTPEGSFNAFIKELPRLRAMGIETLWFMPVTPISLKKRQGSLGSYYACSSYIKTNPEYGSIEDFKNLVTAAHDLGFKVLIDWVANHTGWDHEWTIEHPDFYRRNLDGHFYDSHGWDDVIDLNYDNQELWSTMMNCMQFWVEECDIDGFRCDMAMLVPLDFWKSVRRKLDSIKKLFWLAECEEIHYHEAFDATYTWKWLHRMEAYYRREIGIEGLQEVLNYYNEMFPPTSLRVFFTSNHDENSHSGSEYERLGDAAEAFAVLCCTWNAIPLIYSGQELPNKKRLKFFDRDPIDWNGQYALHDFYKKLLELRKNNPALDAGNPHVRTHRLHTDAGHFIFAFLRHNQQTGHEVLVIINLSQEKKALVHVTGETLTGAYTSLFSNAVKDFTEESSIALDPWEYQVYIRNGIAR
ncbi:MAG: alpha-amylase family glycosyl hydrolase [Bacteroidota bacterium]